MVSQLVKVVSLLVLVFGGSIITIVQGSVLPYEDGEDFLGQQHGSSSIENYRRSGSGGLARRSIYTDSAFIPYIHPRFVMEQDFPEESGAILPPQTKRATKGMLVDVVDFVTKGTENRNQRMGQGMRTSGRR